MNFHFVAIEDTPGNVRFLAKFDLTGHTSYKTCLYCFTIKALYFLNIRICTNGVNTLIQLLHGCWAKYMYLRTRYASIAA